MIVASKLTKFYGRHPAVREISFEIEEGEIVGFLGLNGAGKSTTLRIISCQLVPTSGTVTVAGFNVLESSEEIRRRIGYLPEIPPLYSEMTVRAYLEFAARLKGVPKSELAKRVDEVEETTRLTDVSQQVIGTLSAGYRQRVGIAQAIVHRPELLILDEPFSGLDPVQTVQMREMIRNLGGNHTVLLSSHLLSQIHETCDRILVIQGGRIVAQGKEEELVSLLTGGVGIELEVRGEVERITAAVESIDDVVDYRTHLLEDDVVRVEVQVAGAAERWTRRRLPQTVVGEAGEAVEHVDVREALAGAMHDAGLGLRELRLSRAELESVFIQLTQGESPKAGDPGEAQPERTPEEVAS